ncbi:hypothetical protein [Klebsiella phage 175003]|uniref:HNH homing endonuclease n=3 Tax=Przondovirus TaxID=1985720 RepID=A0A5Q2W676_9CAUD|nr:HNH homing endonuclease [Klebsiella phage 117]WNM71030.1 HNH homing endonuclease [Klebsiella phage vB_KpnP_cmc356ctg1]WPH66477.1 HNH homing endonuclease [Klebsiella phage PEA128]
MSRLNPEALREKITSNVKLEGDCWIWQKSFGSHGYGNIGTGGGRNETVHRVSHEVFNGEIPKGLLVLHSCDNRKCCNPEHLRAGTSRENRADAVARSGITKITQSDADAIRSDTRSQRVIAKDYGISQKVVYNIKRGAAWLATAQKV